MRDPRDDAQPPRILRQCLYDPHHRAGPVLPQQRHCPPRAQARRKGPAAHHIAAPVDPVEHRRIAREPDPPLSFRGGVGGGVPRPDPAPHRSSPGSPSFTASRSEEHTSELQSLMRISYAVFCLKKKKPTKHTTHYTTNTHTEPSAESVEQEKQT